MVNSVLNAFTYIIPSASHNAHGNYHCTNEEIKAKISNLDLTLHSFPQ